MKAKYKKHILHFISPGGTSRGILTEKESWILKIEGEAKAGFGEISLIPGLSLDNPAKIEGILSTVCKEILEGRTDFSDLISLYPAVHFGIEQAFRDLRHGGTGKLFETGFTNGKSGIKMNGLIWMNPIEVMMKDAEHKIAGGFDCIKFKIGSYDFEEERKMLAVVRSKYGDEVEIRVDANGAYTEKNIFSVMESLAKLKIHSIEQPVKPRQYALMHKICRDCEVPVALDEELIGVPVSEMESLLDQIHPAYMILKPSLLGGWKMSDQWLELAGRKNIQWWATSALESNIGLNAISQWVSQYDLKLPQGLGTGSLYQNNFISPLKVQKDELWMDADFKRKNYF